ncbi:hypothetical protein F5Y14DRAFT_442622 [Nemania sp. NC0429]|nr:hypothetical protein F5Y14DRAFT_442622 [Nemania sp. NC0429]
MPASLPISSGATGATAASLATITIAGLVAVGVGISRRNEKPKEIPKKYRTLRILGVPLDIKAGRFENDLQFIATQVPVKAPEHVSLVQKDKNSACGTATFYTSIDDYELVDRLQVASNIEQYPYKFDTNFYGITPLYEHNVESSVDSHAFRSWTSESGDKMWLRDYLPRAIPNHRAILYGYNTMLEGSQSKELIRDLGARFMEDLATFRANTNTSRRPIVFIAHSLGGLLVKERGNSGNIDKACHSMLFFGVPNRGLWDDQLRTIVRGRPSQALRDSLIVDNDSEPPEYLKRMSCQFSETFKDYKYEVIDDDGSLSVTGEIRLLVTKESATGTGLVAAADEDNVPLDADHSGLVKFESRHNQHYLIVKGRLSNIMARAPSVVDDRFALHRLDHQTLKLTDDCLQALAFPEMNSRFHDIITPHAGTCEWLNDHPSFKDWCSSPRALLWIRGKSGSGKSTLLKYALQEMQKNALADRSRVLIISFLFHARGIDLQKSTLGFYRCILHQILSKFPGALADLVDTFDERRKEVRLAGPNWQWHEDELRYFLNTSLPEMLQESSVVIFIDAIDECWNDDAVRLLDDLKVLLRSPPKRTHHLKICFFNGLTITVEEENKADIGKYVRGNLRHLQRGEDIVSRIIRKAEGVFLWAHLMVGKILKLDREGGGHQAMMREIETVPSHLDGLYRTVMGNVQDRETTLRLMQWICFSRRPLSQNEMRWALVIDPDNSLRTLDEYRNSTSFIEYHIIATRINVLSCGLAEVTQSGQVQFIHQSVKDFFTERGLAYMTVTGHSKSAISIYANYCLASFCIRYMAMIDIKPIRQTPGIYAVSAWAAHARDAQGIGLPDYLLRMFYWPSNRLINRWLALRRFAHYDDCQVHSTLLHVAAEHGLKSTVSAILTIQGEGTNGINATDSDGQTPLVLAAKHGHQAVTQLLIAGKANVNHAAINGDTALSTATANGHEIIIQLLLNAGADVNANNYFDQAALLSAIIKAKGVLFAAHKGDEGIVRFLLHVGINDVNLHDPSGQTGLSFLTWLGPMLLLEANADLNTIKNENRCTVQEYVWNGRDKRATSSFREFRERRGLRLGARASMSTSPSSAVKTDPSLQVCVCQRNGYIHTPAQKPNNVEWNQLALKHGPLQEAFHDRFHVSITSKPDDPRDTSPPSMPHAKGRAKKKEQIRFEMEFRFFMRQIQRRLKAEGHGRDRVLLHKLRNYFFRAMTHVEQRHRKSPLKAFQWQLFEDISNHFC